MGPPSKKNRLLAGLLFGRWMKHGRFVSPRGWARKRFGVCSVLRTALRAPGFARRTRRTEGFLSQRGDAIQKKTGC